MSLASVSPLSLLSHTRLDIISRYPLAQMFVDESTIDPWAVELYLEFLKATNPSLNFSENGTKFSLDDYVHEFRLLVGSLKSDGFDPNISRIPLGNEGIINGAHRVAASIALGLQVYIEESDAKDQIYNWSYLKRIGLGEVYCDFILYTYTLLNPNSLAFLISDQDEKTIRRLEKYLKDENLFVGSKSMTLTPIGARRLVAAAYEHNDWWQEKFIETMALERFSSNSPTNQAHLIIINSPKHATPREVKERLRALLPVGFFERVIHGTDTHRETLTLAQFALNKNSLHFNNLSPIGSESRIIKELKLSGQTWTDDDAIDGSSVLEVFGIRKSNDIDYISRSDKIQLRKGFDLHNSEYAKYPIGYDCVLSDPRMHFYISGIKFASLGVIAHQKSFNLNDKNINDLSLISQMLISAPQTYKDGRPPLNVSFWKFQTAAARVIEPLVRRMPKKLEVFVRKLLVRLRIWAERIFKY